MKVTVATFARKKTQGERIAMLTSYDFSMARLADAAGVDAILVGDSLGNVILGYGSTIPVTMEDMIHHGRAVVRGAENAMVIVDMPFMSYQAGVADAVRNAGRLMKECGCAAVKLEGGGTVSAQVAAIAAAGIPVMGHVGLTPQSVNQLGGYRVQGKTAEAAEKLLADALAVERAGAFSIVLECVPRQVAAVITERLSIPTIGIGAGAGCDGQVLVYQDMLGMSGDFHPKFVRRYAEAGDLIRKAFADYCDDVRSGRFPDDEHSFSASGEALKRLY